MLPLLSNILFPLLVFRDLQVITAVRLKTAQGTLEGELSTSRNGTEYYSFYGIPFAKPPVGALRFETPQDPEPWTDVRDAKKLPPICIQPTWGSLLYGSGPEIHGQEDCLYLNVYTPTMNSSSRLPVVVFIHGGAYFSGNGGFFGPQYFMDHPVVVVTIQYRLHILGFLSAADEILPGNYGLKDQRAALKWIQKNIEAFGGDPKSVTLMGQSVGGVMAHFHMHSAASAGLFHRAVSQSGTGLGLWAMSTSQTARRRARALGVLSGCPTLETKELVECLRKVPAKQLTAAFKKFFVFDFTPYVLFTAVVESRNAKDAFLVENPWKQDALNSVPWIVGITKDEGEVVGSRINSIPALMEEWSQHYERLFPLLFQYSDVFDSRNVSTVTASIKKFYFGDNEISEKFEKNFTNMCTDAFFASDTVEAARRHSNKVFFYLYGHRNKESFSRLVTNRTTDTGAVHHGDDLISLSVMPGLFSPVTQGPDLAVSERLVKYWINFAKSGDPNGQQKTWQPFEGPNFEHLRIRTDSDIMEKELLEERYKFWSNIISLRGAQI